MDTYGVRQPDGEDLLAGLSVDDRRPEQPVLLDADGYPIRTWRENYPYDRRVRRGEYERTKRVLQIELLKLQRWVKETGARLVVICEGRDAAGKGGTIQRFTERLNPRGARIVALDKPTERETGQWYFQRYIAHLPTAGEIVFFDRSWYNRAGVERVMGFCSPAENELFLRQCPAFEAMLVADGILLVKFWFSVSRAEQRTRFAIRQVDPVRQWKLSPTDIASLGLWDAYTTAKVDMFRATDTEHAPWTVVKTNDKRRARLEALRSLLWRIDYDRKDTAAVGQPDPLIVGAAATLLEVGEESTDLSPTALAGPALGPGLHPHGRHEARARARSTDADSSGGTQSPR
ncbi:polyphosphate kinase 2 [Streptomyces sp. NBC_01214]|uniref:polyphosphate kinase 2 n=1 Tax=Streptomyces sp. NBC_01214 TaxID=2903777 RepID=UPI00224D4EF0|nr:polyphosphate kinase 2 [Streptomyces sp. NBC_01214]MCX4808656.1 polyphosphate kinase 2 [Streptomyces sp. NBC_01214]